MAPNSRISAIIIPYNAKLDIRNLSQLPPGTGSRYLEVINGEDEAFVAKYWRRKLPSRGIVIDFNHKEEIREWHDSTAV
jgi:uncharacterized protein (DUF1330 family)